MLSLKIATNIGNVTGTDKRIGGIIGRNASKFVENCYNTGTVTSTGENTDTVGGVCGLNSSNYLTNCYYLADSETDKLDGTTFKTAAEFASGEVAYLLNGSTSGDANISARTWTTASDRCGPRFWTAPTMWFTKECFAQVGRGLHQR